MRYYGRIWKGTQYWTIDAEPHVRIRLKDCFKKIRKNSKRLQLKDTLDICKDLGWFMQRYPLEISEKDSNYLHSKVAQFDNDQVELERILLPTYAPKELKLALPPRHYQSVGNDLLLKKKRILIGDDVGLGKTLIGIMGHISIKQPTLIVCQTHLPKQWQEQFEKFTPGIKTHIIKTGKKYDLPEADVYICSYSKLAKWEDIFVDYIRYVVFDEVQELRRIGSNKYSAAKLIADHAEYVLGLSATPIYNYGSEIHAVLQIINPGCLGNWDEFNREWCGYSWEDGKAKVEDPKALGSFLRENYLLIRRTREEVGQELPEVNKIVHGVDYNHGKAEAAEKQLKEIAARLVSKDSTFVMRGQAARELDMKARYITGVAKAKEVANYVKIFLENGEKVLLAGWHRDVYDIWNKELEKYNPVMYTGSETPQRKNKNKEAFVNGDSQTMMISLRSGIGLDGLQQCCSVVIFGELDWSPGVHEQVIGRLHRNGQEGQVTAIFLASEHGTDPLMIDMLGLKASQAQGIMNPKGDILTKHSDEDRLKKLARKILDKH